MKIEQPWQCDSCRAYKKESNGWFIGWTSQYLPLAENKKGVSKRGPGIVVIPWDDRFKDNKGVKHLCGSRCVTAFVAEAVAEMSSPGDGMGAYQQSTAYGAPTDPMRLIAAAEKATEASVAKKVPINKLEAIITKDEKGEDIGEP